MKLPVTAFLCGYWMCLPNCRAEFPAIPDGGSGPSKNEPLLGAGTAELYVFRLDIVMSEAGWEHGSNKAFKSFSGPKMQFGRIAPIMSGHARQVFIAAGGSSPFDVRRTFFATVGGVRFCITRMISDRKRLRSEVLPDETVDAVVAIPLGNL